MKDLVIYGAGGFAREVLQVALDINEARPTRNVRGFLAAPEFSDEKEIQGFPVLGGADWIAREPDTGVAIANGTPGHKRTMIGRLRSQGAPEYPVLIHLRSWVYPPRRSAVDSCAVEILSTRSTMSRLWFLFKISLEDVAPALEAIRTRYTPAIVGNWYGKQGFMDYWK